MGSGQSKVVPKANTWRNGINHRGGPNKVRLSHKDVLVDEDGVGGGIVDFMKYRGFVNNSKAYLHRTGGGIRKATWSLRTWQPESQCYYRLPTGSTRWIIPWLSGRGNKGAYHWGIGTGEAKEVDGDRKKGVLPKDKVKRGFRSDPRTLLIRWWCVNYLN